MTNLVRYQHGGCFHFVTFSCYRRQPLLAMATAYSVFGQEFEAVRVRYGFVIAGYVLMPEHVHLPAARPRRLLTFVIARYLLDCCQAFVAGRCVIESQKNEHNASRSLSRSFACCSPSTV